MTDVADEMREKFSAAFDGELSGDDKLAFEKALAADAELKKEYDEFVALLREANALGESDEEVKVPDLLPAVQAKLRARSGGRFYRDRFSEQRGPKGMMPILMLAVMLLLIVASWFMSEYSRELAPSDAHGAPAHADDAAGS